MFSHRTPRVHKANCKTSYLQHLVKTVCSDSFTPSRYCRTSGQRDDLMWEPWQLLLGALLFGMKLYNDRGISDACRVGTQQNS
ncbi:hypothetical protein ACHWQZ_G012581 [Mnemiopsis leidyi]